MPSYQMVLWHSLSPMPSVSSALLNFQTGYHFAACSIKTNLMFCPCLMYLVGMLCRMWLQHIVINGPSTSLGSKGRRNLHFVSLQLRRQEIGCWGTIFTTLERSGT